MLIRFRSYFISREAKIKILRNLKLSFCTLLLRNLWGYGKDTSTTQGFYTETPKRSLSIGLSCPQEGRMANIHSNPRKTKPPWLEAPCSVCAKYEETESEVHDARKAAWGNPKLGQHFNRCRFHPLFCSPDEAKGCPHRHLVGKTVFELTCDKCGKTIAMYEFGDPRVEQLQEDPVRVDICRKCRHTPDSAITKTPIVLSSDKSKRWVKEDER